MKVKDLLEHLDGAGLTITDYGEMPPFLAQAGLTLDTELNEAQWTATGCTCEQFGPPQGDAGETCPTCGGILP